MVNCTLSSYIAVRVSYLVAICQWPFVDPSSQWLMTTTSDFFIKNAVEYPTALLWG
jgi:hypothetical protein